MNNFETGHKTVDAISRINLQGNITPHAWFETLRMESGKPDMVSIALLSDFIYWHRSTLVRDERTGAVIAAKKKFKADLFQKSYKDLITQFGFSEKQIRESLKRLEEKGVLKRVFRTVNSSMGKLPNTMFIELYEAGIENITFPKRKDVFPLKETPTSLKDNTITKITTENTTHKDYEEEDNWTAKIIQFWDNNHFGYNNNNAKMKLLAYLDDQDFDEPGPIILKALEAACDYDKRNFAYVKNTLHNWITEGIKTVTQLEQKQASFEERKNKKQQQQSNSPNPKQEDLPAWIKNDTRDYGF